MSRLRAIPTPLACVLALNLVLCATWALIVPIMQSPDEQAHFAYVESLASSHRLPDSNAADSQRPEFSTAAADMVVSSDFDGVAQHVNVQPIFDPGLVRAWRKRQAADPRHDDGSGLNNAGINPPLYYAYEVPAYAAVALTGGDEVDRYFGTRLWSALLMLITVTATWLLAGEVFRGRRGPQTAAAGFAAMQPMATFLGSMTTPDAMLMATWSMAMWLAVRILRRGLTAKMALAAGLLTAAAILTKATSYALVPPVAAAVAVALWRRRKHAGNVGLGVRFAAGLGAPVLAWAAYARVEGRLLVNTIDFGTAERVTPFNIPMRRLYYYVKDYYFPKNSIVEAWKGAADHSWIRGAWGTFGWIEFSLQHPVMIAIKICCTAALVGSLVYLVMRRGGRDPWVPVVMALSVISLLTIVHWAEFQQVVVHERTGMGPDHLIQGRYILPVVAVLACMAAAALEAVPQRIRGAVTGLAFGSMAGLQLLAMLVVLDRYVG